MLPLAPLRILLGTVLALVLGLSGPAQRVAASPGTQSDLVAIAGQGTGRVLVASTAEDQGTIVVQVTVNVHNAAPLTTFIVSRAVDLQPDGVCTGSLFPFIPLSGAVITTSPGGAGATHASLHRGAPFVSGVAFDVVFQVVGDDGSVLESACMTVTTK